VCYIIAILLLLLNRYLSALTCTHRDRGLGGRKSSPTDWDRMLVVRRPWPPSPATDSASWVPCDPRPTCCAVSAGRGTRRSPSAIDVDVVEQRAASVGVHRPQSSPPLQRSVDASGHATR